MSRISKLWQRVAEWLDEATASEPPLSNPRRGPCTILVAVGERHVARLVEVNLARAGYRLVTATSAAEALDKAQEHRLDLAVLDELLPDMTAVELARVLRDRSEEASLPIVALLERSHSKDSVLAWEGAADAHLVKPFNPMELLAIVKRFFTERYGNETRGPIVWRLYA